MSIYHINLDSMGDIWYSLPVLRKISELTGKKLDVLNSCPVLNDILKRYDFINSVNDFTISGDRIKVFDILGNIKKGKTLLNCNTSDFVSNILLNDYILTDKEKEFDYKLVKTKEFPKYDLIFHTAKTWNSRSISEDVWNKLYDKYSNLGYKIALIGKDTRASDMIKTCFELPVNKEDNYINKLSLDETMSLINNANILVTGQGGISVLSAGLKNINVVVAEGCVKKEYRYIIRNGSTDYKVKYVKNPSGIYYTGFIDEKVTDDTRQQPTFEDMQKEIDYFLKEKNETLFW